MEQWSFFIAVEQWRQLRFSYVKFRISISGKHEIANLLSIFFNLRSRHEKVRIYPSGRRYVASIWARLPVVWSPDLRQCPCLILSSSVQQGCQISDSVILLSSVKQGYQSGSQTALMPPSMKLVELLLLTQSWNFCLRIDFVGTTMPEGIPVLTLCLHSFKCCRLQYFEIEICCDYWPH